MTGSRHHLGLTLVEVLAATVLLAVVAGTCASLLRDAGRAADMVPTGLAFDELAGAADRWLAVPEEGEPQSPLAAWLPGGGESLDLHVETPSGNEMVRVRRVRVESARDGEAWLEFRSGQSVLWRWAQFEPTEGAG